MGSGIQPGDNQFLNSVCGKYRALTTVTV